MLEKRVSEQQFLSAMEKVRDFAIILMDLEGRIVSWNEGATKLMGYAATEVIGKSGDIIFLEKDRKALKPDQEIESAKKFGASEDERWHVRKDGSIFWGSGLVNCIYAADKRPQILVKIFRDMTPEKRQSENLLRSNRELAHFAHIISHDLQEPLRTLNSYAELLGLRCKGRLDKDTDEYLHYLMEGATRARKMVTALLKYAQLNEPQGRYAEIAFDSLVEHVLKDLQVRILEKKAEIHHSSLPVLAADEQQMFQLFQNLISNAIKFSGDKPPEIFIKADETKEEWVFSIRDNGIGIETSQYDRIFNLFARLHSREEYEGTGMGLAVCKKIVEAHQGRIWVESKPGKGSTFYFTLPK